MEATMPDIGLTRGPGGPGRRICVIGAGISGLVAAKVMRDRGHDVTVVEKSGDLGGVWEPARSYPGVQTQTPRDLYCFSDFPMPAEYPEWPSGAQMHAYLDAYAGHFGLRPCIRFRTEVLSLSRQPGAQGWLLTLRDADAAARVEHFDLVIVATGQFSRPRTLHLPGEDAFLAAGGRVRHSSQCGDGASARDRDVAVVGFSKSATDVAMDALAQGARTVSVIYRRATWKIPYFFGGVVNFKHILYCRASEAMFMPWGPSRAGRLARRLAAPAIWANWRALEALLGMQFGLKKAGLRPEGRIEDSIHCATSIETPGFYKAVRDGRIRMVQGDLTGYGPGCALVGGTRIAADVVVLAIGWLQDLPFLDAETRAKLIEPDGQYRLYRLMANPDLPGLGFVGFNSSFASALSAELGAHWLARYFEGGLRRQPTSAAMQAGIARALEWRRRDRRVAATYGGLCIAPFHHAHFDELMEDMGARKKPANVLAAHLAPVNPQAYAKLLETAPGHDLAAEGTAR
jgi:cation diffusion facilitator CzcD-associated flavoprotein CzcO